MGQNSSVVSYQLRVSAVGWIMRIALAFRMSAQAALNHSPSRKLSSQNHKKA